MVNPWNTEELANAINTAVTMPPETRQVNHAKLFRYVSKYTAAFWGVSFIKELERITLEYDPRKIPKLSMESTLERLLKSRKKKIFLLDYDGTLTSLQPLPEFAKPSRQVLSLLSRLCAFPDVYVYILSGRPREQLDRWFGNIDVGLSAEHGCFYRHPKKVYGDDYIERLRGVGAPTGINDLLVPIDRTLGSSASSTGSISNSPFSRPTLDGWYAMIDQVDSSWRKTILPLFQHYTERY